ncbi:hypothetical protein ACQP1G_24495 [Nocardia sp. CA-107356]|uniref:hypothetical protein n=1 Tax=Nocardia sp. CA-107356 TaxID=3239972 RepID=UPI003D8FDAEC
MSSSIAASLRSSNELDSHLDRVRPAGFGPNIEFHGYRDAVREDAQAGPALRQDRGVETAC